MIPAVSLQHMRETVAGWSDAQKAEAKAIREAIMAVSRKPREEASQMAFWYVDHLNRNPMGEEERRIFQLGVKLHWGAITAVGRENWGKIGKTWADIDGSTVVPTDEEFQEILDFSSQAERAGAVNAVKPMVLYKMLYEKDAVRMWCNLECVDAEIRERNNTNNTTRRRTA